MFAFISDFAVAAVVGLLTAAPVPSAPDHAATPAREVRLAGLVSSRSAARSGARSSGQRAKARRGKSRSTAKRSRSAPRAVQSRDRTGLRGKNPRAKHDRRYRGGPKHKRPIFPRGFVFYDFDRDRRREETVVIVTPPPAPPEPEEVAPPPPPDPRGAIRRIPARGVARLTDRVGPGAILDASIPVVTLDWRIHELTEPSPGETWVRLRRQVLLIDATTREVLAIAAGSGGPVPPAQSAALGPVSQPRLAAEE